jgi:hypothetical protein
MQTCEFETTLINDGNYKHCFLKHWKWLYKNRAL